MNDADFYKEVDSCLGDFLRAENFRYRDGDYYRQRNGIFRDLISFDFDGGNSYRVMIGIDYPYDEDVDISDPPEGALLAYYFSGGGLSEAPRDFPASSGKQISSGIERIRMSYKDVIKSFFDSVTTPEEYANNLTDADCVARYQIYKREGLLDKARKEAAFVLQSYNGMRDVGKIDSFLTHEIEPFLAQTE